MAQISVDDVPTWKNNDRFFSSPGFLSTLVKQPSLSLNGFDCTGRCDEGLGLKQVLEETFSSSPDQSVEEVFEDIVDLASSGATYYPNPTSENHVTRNTQVIQARAFMALASYVLEKNGINRPDLRDHSDYLSDLKSALKNPLQWRTDESMKSDAVKWTLAVTNAARALDLYLALEIAYEHYGDSMTPLLNESNKEAVLENYILNLQSTADNAQGPTPDNLGTTSRLHVENGNYPVKVYTSLGYGALTAQLGGLSGNLDGSGSMLQSFIDKGLESSLQPAGGDRDHAFNYQTADGKRFWAEGPYYFHFALGDVLPFWHAMRINGLLDYHPDFNTPDPFFDSRFTEPLHWLADVVTPDGLTPPLDDGNKHNMRFASVMRWTGDYGSTSVGQKYAWISDANSDNGFGASASLLPVEIAIPRVGLNGGTAPAPNVGNTSKSQTGENGEQQIVLRRSTSSSACDQSGSSGDCHYVLMNGESGASYGRGEGHEQPDQLQLLYYVDGASFLMDSGYDRGKIFGNSTWNHYYDHNVLQSMMESGGLQNPYISVSEQRKKIEVQNSGYLYRTQHGNVGVLHGKQYLPAGIPLTNGKVVPANYKRDALFVDGTDPYLIDFSRVKHWADWTTFANGDRQFKLSYHVNSTSVDLNNFAPDNGQFITWSGVGGSGKNAYVYPLGIEYLVKVRQSNSDVVDKTDTAEEENGPTVNLKRIDIKNFDVSDHPQHFSVATIIQARGQTPSNAPKMLWSGFSQNHQGWVWKQGAETFDVFIGRESKTSASSAVRVKLQNADNQYPNYRIELPSGKRYGFARVHKSGGEWNIDSNYQVNLERAPMQATLTGPVALNHGVQGNWTANVSGGSGSTSYAWEVMDVGSSTYTSTSVTSQTYSHTFSNTTNQMQSAGVRAIVTKGSETDTAQMIVSVFPSCGDNVLICTSTVSAQGFGPNSPAGVDSLALRALQAEGAVRTATLTWTTTGPVPPSRFVVQQRPDTTAHWSALGAVEAADSVRTDSTTPRPTSSKRVGLKAALTGSGLPTSGPKRRSDTPRL